MDESQVRDVAVKTNQAFNGASKYGQMIMNPEQMPHVFEKFYGGHKQVKGTFSDDWRHWTSPWITDTNPDGEYITGILNDHRKPASFYDIMKSPFADAMSIVSTFDFLSSIREGWYRGSHESDSVAQSYVQKLRETAAQEYAQREASISAIRKGRIRRELGDMGVYLDVMESVLPQEYAAVINAMQNGAVSIGRTQTTPKKD